MQTYCSFEVLFYFFAYYEFEHTALLTYCFFISPHTMNSDILFFFSHIVNFLNILLFWFTVFHIL